MNYALLTAQSSPITSYIMLGGMLVLMYFLLFMPQKKQQKRDAKMRANLDIGDEVLTQGGIVGRIVSMKEESIVIETGSDRVKLRVVRGAIVQNTTPKEPEKKEKAKE
ncbi:MAG: preprotein translocase subunit YajC [Oscillospiraceae bacterium]